MPRSLVLFKVVMASALSSPDYDLACNDVSTLAAMNREPHVSRWSGPALAELTFTDQHIPASADSVAGHRHARLRILGPQLLNT